MLISQTESTKDGNRGEMEMEEGEDRDGKNIWGASSSTRRDRYAVCGGRDWRFDGVSPVDTSTVPVVVCPCIPGYLDNF